MLRAGEMLVPRWEHHATAVAHAGTDQELFEALQHVIQHENITANANAAVLIGGDTRPHTEALVQAACEGVELSGVRVLNIGTCTTPVLHYAVLRHNQPDLAPYGERLVEAFTRLTAGVPPSVPADQSRIIHKARDVCPSHSSTLPTTQCGCAVSHERPMSSPKAACKQGDIYVASTDPVPLPVNELAR